MSTHFQPGTHVVSNNRELAVIAIDGEHLLVTDGKRSGWLRVWGLASRPGFSAGNSTKYTFDFSRRRSY